MLKLLRFLSISKRVPTRYKAIPFVAALHNTVWFIWLWSSPDHFMESQQLNGYFPLAFWQWLSAVVLFLGFCYLMNALFFEKTWWFLPLGAASKVVGAVLGAWFIAEQWLPPSFWWGIFINDLMWLLPFGIASYQAFKAWQHPGISESLPSRAQALGCYRDQYGTDLRSLSEQQPILLVFLRHFGCTFCKEALADLVPVKQRLESQNIRLVLVHMGEDAYAGQYLAQYGHEQTHRVSDPSCVLYRVMGLERASFWQVFGLKQWWRGGKAALKGHGIGKLVGDGFQMPGVFLVQKGKVLQSYKHEYAADVPDYEAIASCPLPV